MATIKKTCEAVQINRRAADFTCAKDAGHGGPHIDRKTREPWGDPQVPRGMRRKKGA